MLEVTEKKCLALLSTFIVICKPDHACTQKAKPTADNWLMSGMASGKKNYSSSFGMGVWTHVADPSAKRN